jgi:tetratricopeptide (TPR) repeat protein
MTDDEKPGEPSFRSMCLVEDWISACSAGVDISPDEAAILEARARESLDDLEARVRLVGFYFLSPERNAQARRAEHLHWLITHHPEVALSAYAFIDSQRFPEAYAEGKRRWLDVVAERGNDVAVLRHAADFLSRGDPAIAEELYRRGSAVEPQESRWRTSLGLLRVRAYRRSTLPKERVQLAREALAEYEAALAIERWPFAAFGILMNVAKTAVAAECYERASEAAERILTDATKHERTFQYGNAIHDGHSVLGQIALARGDLAGAAEHLRAAGETRGSPQLNSFGPDFDLASALLAVGQRDAVVDYLRACSRFWEEHATLLDGWQDAIRRGETPDFDAR